MSHFGTLNTQSRVGDGGNGSDATASHSLGPSVASAILLQYRVLLSPLRLKWISVPLGTRYVVRSHCRRHNGDGFELPMQHRNLIPTSTSYPTRLLGAFTSHRIPRVTHLFSRHRRSRRHLLHSSLIREQSRHRKNHECAVINNTYEIFSHDSFASPVSLSIIKRDVVRVSSRKTAKNRAAARKKIADDVSHLLKSYVNGGVAHQRLTLMRSVQKYLRKMYLINIEAFTRSGVCVAMRRSLRNYRRHGRRGMWRRQGRRTLRIKLDHAKLTRREVTRS